MRMTTTTLHTTLAPVSTPRLRSPWHSPVPYLFGGLAAMLGLIAFALLILACSYWRLSRDDTQQQNHNDLESGEKFDEVSKPNGGSSCEEKIVVIMAGNDKPTFLATPAIMLFSNKKNHVNDHDHSNGHVVVDNANVKDDDQAKESTSVQDDEKPKEDEPSTATTNPV